MQGETGYGLWLLVFMNSSIFIFFAFSFYLLSSAWRVLHAAQQNSSLAGMAAAVIHSMSRLS